MNPLLTRRNTMVGRLLRLPLRLIPKNMYVNVRGGPTRGMKWRVGSSTHGCWLGTYERQIHSTIANFVRPGMTAYDIGAHVGYYTLAFSRLCGNSGQVVAFEPFPANATDLLQHVNVNQCANVTIVSAAVSDRVSVAKFAPGENSLTGHISDVGELIVPTVSLDSLNLPLPDFIKIDAEGVEHLVLRGAQKILQSRSAVWLIDRAICADECIRALEGSGHEVKIVEEMILGVPANRMEKS